MKRNVALGFCLLLFGTWAFAQTVVEPSGNPDWSKDYQPFRIVGNLYYVGTYDLGCYLITTPSGNILINTGLAASASTIKSNIETLGFKFSDTKILLTTQAHFDHVGAMAAIKESTHAKMIADAGDTKVLADGGTSEYAFGNHQLSFKPVKVDRQLHDGDTVKLGATVVTMLHHAGHTRGSCSFVFNVKDGAKNYKVLIVNMPTIVVSKKFSEVTEYPGIAKDYAATFASLRQQQFDIWVASHASQFDLHAKHKPGDPYNPEAFIDQKGYDEEVAQLEEEYKKKIASEK